MKPKLIFIENHSLIVIHKTQIYSFHKNSILQNQNFKIKNFIFFYIKTENNYYLTHYINLYKIFSNFIIPENFPPFETKQKLENHIIKTYIK
jgi:hypothetical protein